MSLDASSSSTLAPSPIDSLLHIPLTGFKSFSFLIGKSSSCHRPLNQELSSFRMGKSAKIARQSPVIRKSIEKGKTQTLSQKQKAQRNLKKIKSSKRAAKKTAILEYSGRKGGDDD
ncbi:uncharacterized protein Gasu_04990 [Galdieria sulphuraria]|uniref:Uncharacterized protein n=1 Tax=Galdieria sulphuraria TaxID=130081 RepID=M2Y8M8_GALSU|nr:uncharacterized protein Gasu_04990 [Galdieria sulphuraria]EME32413.1 hypothetical protein Gasu_04990 [Galdieria sulphuraria]|eukprot:XP_005708933.1 hypothetical protein Gasu_04990 [Galdieria sulphuraria]